MSQPHEWSTIPKGIKRLQRKSQRLLAERRQFARVTQKVLRRWLRKAEAAKREAAHDDVHDNDLWDCLCSGCTLARDILRVLAPPTRGGKGRK